VIDPQLLDSLVEALESQLDTIKHYYDRQSGQVVVINEELGDYPEDFDPASARFIVVTPFTTDERFGIMEQFVESLPNESLQDELTQALIERGAFQRFHKVLEKYPNRREQWKQFREDRVRLRAKAWLAQHGLITL